MKGDKQVEKDMDVFDEGSEQASSSSGELVIATIVGFDDKGKPLLSFVNVDRTNPVAALSTTVLNYEHLGRQVAIMFIDQDQRQPVIVGLIKSQLDEILETMDSVEKVNLPDHALALLGESEKNLKVDGNKIKIEANEEIVLKCGESSITLTKSGKILIRGKYLLNRSTGVNRIMGGSVQVN